MVVALFSNFIRRPSAARRSASASMVWRPMRDTVRVERESACVLPRRRPGKASSTRSVASRRDFTIAVENRSRPFPAPPTAFQTSSQVEARRLTVQSSGIARRPRMFREANTPSRDEKRLSRAEFLQSAIIEEKVGTDGGPEYTCYLLHNWRRGYRVPHFAANSMRHRRFRDLTQLVRTNCGCGDVIALPMTGGNPGRKATRFG